MEKQFSEIYHQDTKYQIIGQQAQVLQILLMPEEIIKTRTSLIQYQSCNLKQDPIQQRNALMRVLIPSDEVRLTNSSKTGGYVGIARQHGKILIMDIVITMNYWVRESNIIAMTSKVELQGKTRFQPNFGVGSFKRVTLSQDNIHRSQLIFLQTVGTLVEKELGPGESMMVRSDAIVAFSEKMSVKPHLRQFKFMTITGPGRIYFEGVSGPRLITPQITQVQQKMTLLMGLFLLVLFTWGMMLEIMMEEVI